MENHASTQERKKGKWIRITQGADPEEYMCSRCGRTIKSYGLEELLSIRYPYYHCGADMRGYTKDFVEVCISSNRINVTFNDVDIDRIQKFIGALDRTPCIYSERK